MELRNWQIQVCSTFDAASPFRSVWDHFSADNPMMSWEWMSQWWFELGARTDEARNRLMLAIVIDAQRNVVGIAPFYLQTSWLGRSLRLLGDGQACSDHVRILGIPERLAEIAHLLGGWITSPEFLTEFGQLDRVIIEGYDESESSWAEFWKTLETRGWHRFESQLESSWVLHLDASLDQIQRRGRDSLRRKTKRLLKLVDSSEVDIEMVEDLEHFDQAWPDFVRLHQRRRQELGQPGCFACPRFERFLRNATRSLIPRNRARLWFATKQGMRFGTTLTLQSDSRIFLYQSGMDSSFQSLDPGHICNAYLIRWAHEQGLEAYDFLRGDEAYKRHLGAAPQSLWRSRFVAPTWSAQAKERLYQIARKTRQQSGSILTWIRQQHTVSSSKAEHVSN